MMSSNNSFPSSGKISDRPEIRAIELCTIYIWNENMLIDTRVQTTVLWRKEMKAHLLSISLQVRNGAAAAAISSVLQCHSCFPWLWRITITLVILGAPQPCTHKHLTHFIPKTRPDHTMFHHSSAGEQTAKEEKGGAPNVLTRHPSEFGMLKTQMQRSCTISLFSSSLARSPFSDVFMWKGRTVHICV